MALPRTATIIAAFTECRRVRRCGRRKDKHTVNVKQIIEVNEAAQYYVALVYNGTCLTEI